MRDRWQRKASKNTYDPQIGQAALANTELAQRSEDWNQKYFDEFVKPAMTALVSDSAASTKRLNDVNDLQMAQAKTADERYRTLGIPAEDRYYKMVADYSAPEEQEKQARAALGDVRTAAAGQSGQLDRRFQSLGIDPTSPAALAARSDMAVQNSATEAGAATRAREAAKVLGMSLTGDAANFGRGGASGVLAASTAAGGAAGGAAQVAANAAGAAPGGAANVNTSFGTSGKAYGANLDAYTGLGNTSINNYQSPLAGIGALAGQLGSAYLGKPGSDRRIKKDIVKLATLAHDIGLWAFRYIWDAPSAPLHVGYMADEVERVFPDAVIVGPTGIKRLDYSKVLV